MTLTRTARISSPLDEELLFFSMTARESLGRPFAYQLEVLAPDERIDLSELLGKTLTVELELNDGGVREFNGFVTSFELCGEVGRYVCYRAELRPWLWLLSQTQNCRIFQNQTVPDVMKSIFREHGFTDFVESLSSEYRTWEYLVQYRESDLNFVSRLMEQEGIYYFFRHESGKHQMILADSYSAHEALSGYAEIPYFPPQSGEQRDRDHIDSWRAVRRIRPGVCSAADFDFERPKAKLASTLRSPQEHAKADYELYDYPGEFRDMGEADTQVRVRLEQEQVDYETTTGAGNARNLLVGALFTLAEYPRDDQNKEYLVVDARYELRVSNYESIEAGNEAPDYRCSFVAIDSKRPFRAGRNTPKPLVEGPQTATVVGQQGQEIWTDEYGRVKVQFHWDRLGSSDENSSCWVRVAQIWAGSGFGGIHIPRIGQEVIVDFLEGDPDRPIIVGRVYNADNMPPYGLPQNQTQSGIKSRSSKDGTPDNFNEIRFEDKKGQEELFIQAEKNQTTKVKVNQSISVGGSRSISVGGDESTSVTGTRSATIEKKETQTFNDARVMTVATTDDVTVTGKHTGKYDGTREVTVQDVDTLTVNGNKVAIVHGSYDIVADTLLKITQGGNTLAIENKIDAVSEGPITFSNGQASIALKDGKVVIDAANELTLTCGAASITLKNDGTIEVSGAQKVALSGGSGTVELSAPGATMGGPKVTVQGAAMTEITGAMVKIN